MSELNNVDGTTETPIDWEARAKKAEAKIVDIKTNQKETPKAEEAIEAKTTVDTPNFMTREDFEQEKFFEQNEWLLDHRDKIKEYVSKWYSLDDAKTVLLSKDKTIEARKNTQNSNFTAWTPDFNKSTYTMDDLKNLSQNEYNQVIKLKAEGKIIIN